MDELDAYPVAAKDELDSYPPPVTQEGSTGKAKAGGGVSRGDELFQPDPSPAPLLEGDVTGGAMPAGSHAQAATDAVSQGKRAGLDANPFKDDWIAQEVVNGVVLGGAGKVAGSAARGALKGAARLAAPAAKAGDQLGFGIGEAAKQGGRISGAVQKVADVTAKVRHMASTAGAFAGMSGHAHGAIPIVVDAAVSAAPRVARALERGIIKLDKVISRSGVPAKALEGQAKLATELRTAEQHIAERKAIDEAKDLTKDAFDPRLSQSERYAATKKAFERLGELGNEDQVLGIGKSGAVGKSASRALPETTTVDDPKAAASRAFASLLGGA